MAMILIDKIFMLLAITFCYASTVCYIAVCVNESMELKYDQE